MLEIFVITYGYWALFIGTLLEGEIVLVLAGFMANIGYMDLRTVIAVAFLGSVVSDQFFFWLGRTRGQKIIENHPKIQKRIQRVLDLFHKHQVWVMMTFRFLYGFRIMSPLGLGMSEVRTAKFVFFNVLGAAIWAFAFGVGGYLFSNTIQLVLSDVNHYGLEIIGSIAGLIVLIWGFIQVKKHVFDRD